MYYQLQQVERICKDLNLLIDQNPLPVRDILYQPVRHQTPAEADSGAWQPFGSQDRWGAYDAYSWFRADVTLPQAYAGRKVVLEITVDQEYWTADSRQFILFVDGEMKQGVDVNHRRIVLCHDAVTGTTCRLDLQAYAGLVEKRTGLELRLLVEDEAVKAVYYDLHVPCQVAAELPEGDKARFDILHVLNQAIQRLDLRKPGSQAFIDSVRRTRQFMENEFYQKLCGRQPIQATAVGHTHIDVAWLWTLAQTRQKIARSFSTVLQLMDLYPDYVFMSSQPQLYRYLQQDYPEVFKRVKARIAEGRWEAEGGMWVEADCNLTSGESLVRQFLYGKRYFREQFGVDNRILWLPDVFGYSAALPQIMKKAGIDYFMTTKINWNQYNQIPADTFRWQGIDGSTVLTHFITTSENTPLPQKSYFSTYNGYLAPAPVMRGWKRYLDKQIHEDILVAYGYGDGGGGTTEDMIERGRRMARGIPGCPRVTMETSRTYFERTAKQLQDSPWLKRWVGELYFEYHRGTYTSMARNKRANRKAELLYQDAEFMAVLAGLTGGMDYPATRLAQGWEKILLNQFHDILPGSSIEPVYVDSQQDYKQILTDGRAMLDEAMDQICSRITTNGQTAVIFNTTGFCRTDVACLPWPADQPLPAIHDCNGDPLAVQQTADGLLVCLPQVPAKGYTSLRLQPGVESDTASPPASSLQVDTQRLENRFWLLELDGRARITRLYDKTVDREVLYPGAKANVLCAFEDKPMGNDNWDIDIYYQQKSWEVSELQAVEVVETGPVRAGLRITRPYQDSTIVQTIYLYDQIPRIDFATWIDWNEDETLLKVEFPVDIQADQATYDIQFGNITRPTHWNTSWDWARFEVCAHKWADLSEEGYGVSLLNDCKYGHDIRDHVMRLTLLKSGNSPNPRADREEHRFVYALYPHAGTWRQADTMHQAYNLNQPLLTRMVAGQQEGQLPAIAGLLTVDKDHVLMETVKQAEDGQGVIIRLFEFKNQRGPVRIDCDRTFTSVTPCNLLEESTDEPLQTQSDTSFSFPIKPYEIRTFRIEF